jgi:hypothetical protein
MLTPPLISLRGIGTRQGKYFNDQPGEGLIASRTLRWQMQKETQVLHNRIRVTEPPKGQATTEGATRELLSFAAS